MFIVRGLRDSIATVTMTLLERKIILAFTKANFQLHSTGRTRVCFKILLNALVFVMRP